MMAFLLWGGSRISRSSIVKTPRFKLAATFGAASVVSVAVVAAPTSVVEASVIVMVLELLTDAPLFRRLSKNVTPPRDGMSAQAVLTER